MNTTETMTTWADNARDRTIVSIEDRHAGLLPCKCGRMRIPDDLLAGHYIHYATNRKIDKDFISTTNHILSFLTPTHTLNLSHSIFPKLDGRQYSTRKYKLMLEMRETIKALNLWTLHVLDAWGPILIILHSVNANLST